jgi:alanine racemase
LTDTPRSTRATIDLRRLEDNFAALGAYAGIPLLPVVKADAYGHGAPQVAAALVAKGAQRLAVMYAEEALRLRAGGIGCELVVLGGFESAQLPQLAAARLTPVLSTPRMVSEVGALGEGAAALMVHLKVDVGMTRLGLAPADVTAAAEFLARRPGVKVDGLMTHLSAADEDAEGTARQLDVFDAVLADLRRHSVAPQWVHAANSAGLADLRPSHTLARPGILLYGQRPRPRTPQVAVQPVMSVSSAVLYLRDVAEAVGVSYGGRFVTQRRTRVASVPIGYADGVPRTQAMSRDGYFLARAKRAPVAGTVCMDFTMLDVTDIPELQEGDPVTFFGDAPTAWEVAEWSGTTVWQVLTAIGARVPRVYVRNGATVAVASSYSGGAGTWA